MLTCLGWQRGRRDLGKQETDSERREEGDGECRERNRGESGVRADARRKLVQEEPPKAAAARWRLAVHEGMAGGDQVVQAFGRRVEREVAAGDGEVAAGAAVEPAELEHFVGSETLHASVRLQDQVAQARPARAAILDETVDRHHGPNVSLRSIDL